MEYKTELFWFSSCDGSLISQFLNEQAEEGWTLHSIAMSWGEHTRAYLVVLWREAEAELVFSYQNQDDLTT